MFKRLTYILTDNKCTFFFMYLIFVIVISIYSRLDGGRRRQKVGLAMT